MRLVLLAMAVSVAAAFGQIDRPVEAAKPTRPLVVVLAQGIGSCGYTGGCGAATLSATAQDCGHGSGTAYRTISAELTNLLQHIVGIPSPVNGKPRVVEFSYSGRYCGSASNPDFTKPIYASGDTCRGVYGVLGPSPQPANNGGSVPQPDFSSDHTDEPSARLRPRQPETGASDYLTSLIDSYDSNTQFIFVGHSLGGLLVSAWVAQRPKDWVADHVRAVVTMDSMVKSGIGPQIGVSIFTGANGYCGGFGSEAAAEIANDGSATVRPIAVINGPTTSLGSTDLYHLLTSQCIPGLGIRGCIGQSVSIDSRHTLNLRDACAAQVANTSTTQHLSDVETVMEGPFLQGVDELQQYGAATSTEHGCGFTYPDSRCWIASIVRTAAQDDGKLSEVPFCSAELLKGFSGSPAGSVKKKPLDLALVIDSTNSMKPYIDSVKGAATQIVSDVARLVPDYRISIIDFRDLPQWTGIASDYPFKLDAKFTNDQTSILAAISGLATGGGGDVPESDYSALISTMRDGSTGGWRNDAQILKEIILISDAPPHDPEPITGFTRDDVSKAALALDPAVIQAIVPGDDANAQAQLGALATATGGNLYTPADASQVVPALVSAIGTIADTEPPAPPMPPSITNTTLTPPSSDDAGPAVAVTLVVGLLAFALIAFAIVRRRGPGLALVTSGGVRYPLRSGAQLLGRDPRCEVQFDDGLVSRQHARLVVAQGATYIEDLGSQGGTYLNGAAVRRAPLRPGDVLRLGETELRVWQTR